MKNYLDPFYKKYESIIDEIVYQADKSLDVISHVPKYILEKFNGVIENMDEQFYDRLNKNTPLARLMRYGSLPWSLVIPKGYKYFYSSQNRKPYIFQEGVHMMRAKVGGGKSLASFVLAEIYLKETGLSSYFTSPVEKPQLTKDGEFYFVYHRHINLDDYFDKNGKKIKKFNTKKHQIIMKDERHLDFNPRDNGKTEYNNKFKPQQKDEILMRHQGIKRIYKLSQFMKLDSQDMQALTYMHDVETVKDIPIQRWLDSGEFNYIPIKLKFTTYIIDIDFDKMKRKKLGSYKIKIPYELLERFDTHAEKYRDAGLPVDYK